MTTKRKKTVAKKSTSSTASTGHPVQVKICRTVWRDSRSGQFLANPEKAAKSEFKRVPLDLSASARIRRLQGRHDVDDLQVTRVWGRDEYGSRVLKSLTVRWPEARAAHRRGELTAAQLRVMEQDVASDLFDQESAQAQEHAHRYAMHAAHNSDKAKRAAATRSKGFSRRPKARTADQIRADHLEATRKRAEAERQLVAAKTDARRNTLRVRVRRADAQLGKLSKEARAAGVRL